jgi:3-deoxy-manno-octulosonate cytidylyltransferase (CMP-KDO synthetase)
MIPVDVLDRLIDAMIESKADMGTAAVPFDEAGADPNSPNAVKVVVDKRGFALYFSRSLIPFPRQGGIPVEPMLHWGLYAYTRDFLQQFVKWPQSPLEMCEKLEQLRALENGARIMVIKAHHRSIGVDTPEDLAMAEKFFLEHAK